jgi:hypothetical protein
LSHQRYPKARKLKPGSRQCKRLALKLRDISQFAKELQQPFTRWYNRTRPRRRRGHLWAERFKSTILEGGLAVWHCWRYLERNPVRAHMVGTPADYRFCSFGEWSGTGHYPFAQALCEHVLPLLKGLLHVETLQEAMVELRKEFARLAAQEQNATEAELDATIAAAAENEKFVVRTDRRVRYWVDGVVIGSRQFVRETIIKTRGVQAVKRRRLAAARTAEGGVSPLCCFKQLRVLLE